MVDSVTENQCHSFLDHLEAPSEFGISGDQRHAFPAQFLLVAMRLPNV
jgi:hypothetical protein